MTLEMQTNYVKLIKVFYRVRQKERFTRNFVYFLKVLKKKSLLGQNEAEEPLLKRDKDRKKMGGKEK